MKRKQLIHCLWLLAFALWMAACTSEEPVLSVEGGQPIELSGQKSHLITRAGDEKEEFDVGTRYWLYGVGTGEYANTWTEGTETANNTIDYGTVISFGSDPMDFYGVTYGSTTELPDEMDATNISVKETVVEDKLPDLMFSNNLTNQTVNNGYRLEMDFKHAMSKLKFMIVKQDESEDEEGEKKLESVTLKKIVVKGTHGSGTLDIANGKWDYSDETKPDRTYYNSEMEITTTSTAVEGELLIFPNETGEQVTVSVTLGGLGSDDKVVDYQLRTVDEEGVDQGVFQFAMNHEYTLLITVLKDDVRTIAIAPQVYDWVDVNHDNYLGQPVTFANLMWMDRNLGAKSADCYNDWENCRGYYYQYARNIPYILDKKLYDSENRPSSDYDCLYTYNQRGEKVYGKYDAKQTLDDGTIVKYPNIAVNPGDDGIYQFIRDGGSSGIWMYDENGSNEYSDFINNYWTSSTENHPCPKGWRVPTIKDFATFMPEHPFPTGNWYEDFHRYVDYSGNQLGYQEDEIHGNINDEWAIYIIKRKGRTDCYRIKIQLKESLTLGKRYFEFSYFPGNESMSFTNVQSVKDFNELGYDWSNPSSTMQVPACGFIHTSGGDKLDNDGVSTILRTSDWVRAGYNWVCYLRGDISFGIFNGSRKALGDQIRCVRDVTVNKE